MRNLVIYSSKTGNTKKVAQAIAKNLNYDLVSVMDINDIKNDDKIIFGFYVDKGLMDNEAKRVAKLIKNKKIGLFMTLGADPKGEHAKDCFSKAKKFFEKNENIITHEFISQGAIDPNLIEEMKKMYEEMGDKAIHKIDEARIARWNEAAKHPDENDLKNAILAFRDF